MPDVTPDPATVDPHPEMVDQVIKETFKKVFVYLEAHRDEFPEVVNHDLHALISKLYRYVSGGA